MTMSEEKISVPDSTASATSAVDKAPRIPADELFFRCGNPVIRGERSRGAGACRKQRCKDERPPNRVSAGLRRRCADHAVSLASATVRMNGKRPARPLPGRYRSAAGTARLARGRFSATLVFVAPLAQWIEHRSTEPKVAGSSPAGCALFFRGFLNSRSHQTGECHQKCHQPGWPPRLRTERRPSLRRSAPRT